MKKLVLFVATIIAVAFAACCNNAESTEATEEVIEDQIIATEEVAAVEEAAAEAVEAIQEEAAEAIEAIQEETVAE